MPSANPGELASDIGAEYGLPPSGFYEYALDAGVNVNDRAALVRLAQCVKRAGWDMQQCATAQASVQSPRRGAIPLRKSIPRKFASRHILNKVILTIAAMGLHVVAPDLRGYGPGRGHDGRRRGMRPWKSGSHETPRWRKPDSDLYGAFPVK
jgi:hypothetical protein